MSKPSKSKPSNKPAASSADQAKETLKLKKDAAEPGVIPTTDTGEGKGDSASVRGGKTSVVDSSLVGKSETGRPAAQPKPAPKQAEKGAAAAASSSASATSKAATSKSDATSKDGTDKDAKSSVPPVDARGKAAAGATEKPGAKETQSAKRREPAAQPQTPPRKTGFWPVAFGGVVAAGLGAAATIWALPNLPAGWLPEQEAAVDVEAIKADAVSTAEEAARQAVAEALPEDADQAADIQAALEDQGARIAALEEAAPAAAEPAATSQSAVDSSAASGDGGTSASADSSPASETLAQLQDQLEQQANRIAELESRPSLDPETAERIQSVADQADSLQQQISSAAEEAKSQISAVAAEASKLQEAAAESTKRAEAVAAVAALQSALDKGVTAQDAQQTLADAGMDAPEALQQDIPSIETLQDSFGDASRAALRATMSGDSAEGGNMLTNFLKAQTGARSVAPREGDDPDAVLSRANAKVEAGDIAAALDEIEALPAAAKEAPVMAEWLSGATAQRNAQAALSDLSATTN